MMKYIKGICVFAAMFIVVLMCFKINRVERVWDDWISGREQKYYGNINLWHIDDEFSIRIPYGTILKKYEKNNFGIFVNVNYLSGAEAKAKMEGGEKPDIITYSENLFDKPEKVLEKLDKVDTEFDKQGLHDGNQLAYLLCYDEYTLSVNDDLMYEKMEDTPSLIEPKLLVDLFTGTDFGEGVAPIGYTGYGGILYMLDSIGNADTDLTYNKVTISDFAKGKVGAVVCSSLELDSYGGELPSHTEYSFSSFCNRGRYISVLKGKDKNRVECSKEIARLFMGDSAQKKISDKAFSVRFGYSGLNKDENIVLPNVFDYTLTEEKMQELLSNNKKELYDYIQRLKDNK